MLAFALPALIAAAAPAAHVSSSVCPSTDRTPIVSRAPGARSRLVPSGAVTLTVCRYSGLREGRQPATGAAPHELVATGVTDSRRTITRVTSELDAIRPTRNGGAYACPADFGTELLAFFTYRSRPADVVTVGLSGCNLMTNGHLRRFGRSAPVIAQLTGLAEPLASNGGTTTTGTTTTSGTRTGPEGPPPVPIWEPAGA